LARKLYRRFYRGAAEIAEQAQRDFDRRKNSLRLLSDLCGSAVIMTISTYSESQGEEISLILIPYNDIIMV